MEEPPAQELPAAEEVKAEEAAPVAATAAPEGLVLAEKRQRKRTVNAEYVQLYDEEMYASEGSGSDGEPRRGGKRRAGGGSTPAQRAKRVRGCDAATGRQHARLRACRPAAAARAREAHFACRKPCVRALK